MTEFAGIFEVLASDQHDARLASRKALVLSRDRIDARLGKFLAASQSPTEFDARYDLVADDFAGLVRVAADEIGHDDPDSLIVTLHDHYAKDWIQKAVKKPGDLHKKLDVPEGEKIPEEKIEHAEETGDKNLKEKAQFAENVKKGSTVSDYLSSYYRAADEEPDTDKDWSNKFKKTDDDDDDEDDHKAPPFGKKDDEDDDSKESKTDDAVPLVSKTSCEHSSFEENCPDCWTSLSAEDKLKIRKPSKDDDERESSVRTADEGNTGLAGPSPKMDKARWTPQSVKPIDVPSERHPTIQKDVTKGIEKNNLTGPAHDMEEINAQTTTEKLPTATDYDGGGFATGGEEFGPNTKTFPKGNQTTPVTKQIVEE